MKKEVLDHFKTGATCPFCGKFGKVYQRLINFGMVQILCHIRWAIETEKPEGDWIMVTRFLKDFSAAYNTVEYSKLKHWNLLDGNIYCRKGLWKLTQEGYDWTDGKTQIQSKIFIFGDECIGYGGDKVYMHDVIGKKLRWDEIIKVNR